MGATLPFTLRISGGPQSYAGQFELQGQYERVNVGVAGTLREDGFAVLSGSTTPPPFLSTAGMCRNSLSNRTTRPALSERFNSDGDLEGTRSGSARNCLCVGSAELRVSRWSFGGRLDWTDGHQKLQRIMQQLVSSRGHSRDRISAAPVRQHADGLGEFGSWGCNGNGCWVPLSGSANGPAITSLTGHLTHELLPNQSGDRVITISDFSATVDDLGRMHARYVYSSENRQWLPSNPLLHDGTSRLEMESVWLRREP